MDAMRTALRLLSLWSLLTCGLAAQAARPQSGDIQSVHHQFQLESGNQHVTVAMRVCGLKRDRLTVRMPAWRPGSYQIQDFGKAVRDVTATDASGRKLQVTEGEGPSWSVETTGKQDVSIHYQLPLKVGAGPRRGVPVPVAGQKKPEQVVYHEAYVFQGPSTWMYVPQRLDVEQQVTFKLPAGWDVATPMTPTDKPNVFTSPDYDILADCPFHIGKFEIHAFKVDGVPYRIVLSGYGARRKDCEALVERTRKIVKAQLEMMGKAPFSDYTFLFARTRGAGGGGLEHLNSTNISVPSIDGSTPGNNSRFDSLVSHEFFHLWNVKRLRPRALGPFDYTRPNRTRYLWLSEGVTSYYGDLCCVRAGVWNEEHYWTHSLAAKINKLQSNPGRQKISVAETSWTVWDHSMLGRVMRRQAPDYYNKGELLGLLLDVKIRDATNGKGSLDDVMRGLLKQCMDQNQGFADGDVRKWCEKVAGTSFKGFFKDYVDGTEELPFTKELSKIGLIAKPVERRPTRTNRRPGRQRPPSWRVEIDTKASKRALRLRSEMTRRIKD
jgi:predicted metalloprotease with PDZ domain